MTIDPVKGLKRALGEELVDAIQSSKILVVGSGGIGCELLKDLALSGFLHVQVVDLDTIDVSNLNRQLLFRSQHVGQPKCTVACQVARQMTGQNDARYIAHHGNVCDNARFNVPFVSQFQLVLNALDNVEARRRVNRLCLAAAVPLIEAGTTGYLGQVTVIHKPSQVACYECKTQETQKVYPICTIRSTPSMPVHTIVWAKELYKLLFHDKPEESMLFEDTAAEDSEKSTYMHIVQRVRASIIGKEPRPSQQLLTKNIAELLVALYQTEIEKQISMDKYKTAKKTPTPLGRALLTATPSDSASVDNTRAGENNQSVWQPQRCVAETAACLLEASNKTRGDLLQEFDKDDDLCMRFVTANANLRASVFGIEPLQSIYSAKGIAGNIIPAIATTNAICAGLQMLQVYKILEAQAKLKKVSDDDDGAALDITAACKYVNCIRNKTRNGLYVTASSLEMQNPHCFVCKNAVLPLTLNTTQWKLADFLTVIVKGRLGFEQPTIMLQGDVIWEEGEGSDHASYEPNLVKAIVDLPCGGIRHGTIVEMEDFSQDLMVQVSVVHQDVWDEGKSEEDMPFTVGGEIPKAVAGDDKTAAVAPTVSTTDEVVSEPNSATENNGGEDDVVVMEEQSKRKAELDMAEDEPAKKKIKVLGAEDELDVIEIDGDDDDGGDDNDKDMEEKGDNGEEKTTEAEIDVIEID